MDENITIRGKGAFVSGATGAIGRSIAIALANNGCNLFLTGRNEEKLDKIANEISSLNVSVSYMAGDLVNRNKINEIIKEANDYLDSIDIIINSAGVFPYINLIDISDTDFSNVMDINFRSALIFTREFSKKMIKRKWGRIVNIGSSSAYNGFKRTSLYCASKHALLGFSKSIHDELKQYNIRSYCISPSSTQSKMGLETKNQDYSTFLDPKDVAKYVIFAISFEGNIISEEILLKRMFTQ